MTITLLTNEYPPHIYGGAGVHVEQLVRHLAPLLGRDDRLDVLCFGEQRERFGNVTVTGVGANGALPHQEPRHKRFMETMLRDLVMAGSVKSADIVHCHTWYTHLAGCLLKQLTGARLTLTTHSLEPQRPWKREQLGTAYDASAWIERTAYCNADGVIAVSRAMKRTVRDLYGVPARKTRVIYNGVDLQVYRPAPNPEVLAKYGIDSEQPYALFVGRITRQKGIIHLVRAAKYLGPGTQLVLCAGAPDTEEIGREMAAEVERARDQTSNRVVWIPEVLPRGDVVALYSQAAVFVCPSVYEPFGLINVEAMACETPVVASAVGGIPEIVVDGETGLLVPFEPAGGVSGEPLCPERFSRGLATAVNTLVADPARRRKMGRKARERVERLFSWDAVARKTLDYYRELAAQPRSSA